MATASLILILVSLAVFAGSWIVAAREGIQAEAAQGAVSVPRRVLLFVWPFAAQGRLDPENAHGRRAGKAQIALIASVMVAVAAASVYTNLTHVRPAKAVSAAALTPTQS